MRLLKKLLFLCFFFIFIACQNTPAFVGSWELVSLKLAEDEITANELGDPIYSFNADKTYSIEVTGLSQSGTWELEGEQLLLTDKENISEAIVLNIVQSEETIFHYTAGEGETVTHVILKRAN